MTWPGSTSSLYVQYDYDLTGAMIAVRENGAATGTGVLASYAYNDLGQRLAVIRAGGAGASTSYAYNDPAKRLSQIAHNLTGTADDLTLDFTYSPASQIATRAASNDLYSWTAFVSENVADFGLTR